MFDEGEKEEEENNVHKTLDIAYNVATSAVNDNEK